MRCGDANTSAGFTAMCWSRSAVVAATVLMWCPLAGCTSRNAYRNVVENGGGIIDFGLLTPDADVNFDPKVRRLTDDDFARLLPSLNKLNPWHVNLTGAAIGDPSVRLLARSLSRLEGLVLSGTAVTPGGLAELQTLPRLRRLWVDAAVFGEGEVAHLQRHLPDVRIIREVTKRMGCDGPLKWRQPRRDESIQQS